MIEISETALLDSPERWSARLGRIRALGMAIAIDAFGVGCTSLADLFQFRPDVIKLDLTSTQRLNDANIDAVVRFRDALVRFRLEYGGLNGCGLILEGTETEEHLHDWQQRGVPLFQGSLFAGP